jgi:(p)ppGpp synthase/HD superfamily hydrolase
MMVVRSYHELNVRRTETKDKIVVFNPQCDWQAHPFACYDLVVAYRVDRASFAAICGAKVASRSIDLPHTGMIDYIFRYSHEFQ